MRPLYYVTLLVWLMALLPLNASAQQDLNDRFSGIYTVERGLWQAQFVLYPRGDQLQGNIVYRGLEYPLSASIDGLTLTGVFGQGEQRVTLRMPYSSASRFLVTFSEDESGAWTFIRAKLPPFAGRFSGDFGRITLQDDGRGLVSGVYQSHPAGEPMALRGFANGLEAQLEGALNGKLLFSLDERRYFVQLDDHFAAASYVSARALERQRRLVISRDNYAWDKALAKGTEEALETYRKDWPKGQYVGQIETVKARWHWQKTKASGRFEDYVAHIERFADSPYAEEAQKLAWQWVSAQHNEQSYDLYLSHFGQGLYADKARAGKEQLAWRQATRADSISAYGEYAKRYPNGRFLVQADDSAWQIANKVQSHTAFNAYARAFPKGANINQVAAAKAKISALIEDNEAYRLARQRNSQAGYRAYLAQYPDGQNVAKANAAINAIVEAQLAEQDDKAWQSAIAAQTPSAINYYAIVYPQGRHIGQVSSALENLRQLERQRADKAAFTLARNAQSKEGFQHYIASRPDGQYIEQAQSAIAAIDKARQEKQQQIADVQHQLAQLGLYKGAADGVLEKGTIKAIKAFQQQQQLVVNGHLDEQFSSALTAHINYRNNLKKAKAGSARHMLALAEQLRQGEGIKADRKQAMSWFLKAAKEGQAKAMGVIGEAMANGTGLARAPKEGVNWLKKAVRLGDGHAMYVLGRLYLDGKGVPQHSRKGVGWLTRAAQQGHVGAMRLLGDIYAQGLGVKKDPGLAKQWYDKAQMNQSTEMAD